jgi:hypothetical protein
MTNSNDDGAPHPQAVRFFLGRRVAMPPQKFIASTQRRLPKNSLIFGTWTCSPVPVIGQTKS